MDSCLLEPHEYVCSIRLFTVLWCQKLTRCWRYYTMICISVILLQILLLLQKNFYDPNSLFFPWIWRTSPIFYFIFLDKNKRPVKYMWILKRDRYQSSPVCVVCISCYSVTFYYQTACSSGDRCTILHPFGFSALS